MCQQITVEVDIKTDERAGSKYSIETSVTYDPLRNHVDISISVQRDGFTGAVPDYTYESDECPGPSATVLLERLKNEDQVWSAAVSVFHGNENAKRILDGLLSGLLMQNNATE